MNYNYGYDGGESVPAPKKKKADKPKKEKRVKKVKGARRGISTVWLSALFTILLFFLLAFAFAFGFFIGRNSPRVDLFQNGIVGDGNAQGNTITAGLKTKQRYIGKNPGLNISRIPSDASQSMSAQEVFQQCAPSMVEITTILNDELSGEFMYGYGSGIIMSQDGYIITNAHVLCDSTAEFYVRLFDGREFDAQIVGADPQCDVGILKINASGLTSAQFANGSDLQVGQTVYTIGNPGGDFCNYTFCQGIVSGLNRSVQIEDTVSEITYIQTDASINPGNSGGALVNEYGQVVGINVASIDGFDNIGFSIPIDQVSDIVDYLFEYGYVPNRMRIGVRLSVIDEFYAGYYDCESGLKVLSVSENSYFEKSGGKVGDIITHADGQRVEDLSQLQNIISKKSQGSGLKLTVSRKSGLFDNAEQMLTIDLPLIADDTQF